MRTAGLVVAALTFMPGMGGRPSAAEEPPVVRPAAGAEGFVLSSASGEYKLQLRAYTHFDGRFYTSDDDGTGTDAFLLRRVRPMMQGSLGTHFEFRVMPDFAGSATTLQEAYFEVRYTPKAQVRVGKFKAPVGLERLQSATAIVFPERALPTGVVPNRDLGIQISGDLAGGALSYALGVFDGAADGGSVDTDAGDDKDLDGRLFVSPFRNGTSFLRGLGIGVAGTVGRQAGPLPGYRSPGQLAFFSYGSGVVAAGRRTRVSPQLSFYRGPFGLTAEYARSSTGLRRTAGSPDLVRVDAEAWQATASLALTRDDASYSGLRPKRPLDPARGQWGAFELALRVHALEIDADAFRLGLADAARSARKASAWGVGINWYLTRHVKQVLSFDRTTYADRRPGGDRAAENVLVVRSQLSF